MSNIEQARIEYAHQLETELAVNRNKIAELTTGAAWQPKLGVHTSGDASTITMEINGKRQSVRVDLQMVGKYSNIDIASAIYDSFAPLLEDAIKPLIATAMLPVQQAAASALATPIMGS